MVIFIVRDKTMVAAQKRILALQLMETVIVIASVLDLWCVVVITVLGVERMIAANQRRSVVMVKTMVAAQKTTLVMEGKEIAIMINNVLDRWYAVKITVLGVVLMIAANPSLSVVVVKTMAAAQKANLVT